MGNTEIKSENIELKAENVKLKQALGEHESRFIKLDQNDKDTASENAELKARVVKLKQKQLQTDEEKSNHIILRSNGRASSADAPEYHHNTAPLGLISLVSSSDLDAEASAELARPLLRNIIWLLFSSLDLGVFRLSISFLATSLEIRSSNKSTSD
ncbi:1604_t:CDS:2, partial [Scutellospora calospora]